MFGKKIFYIFALFFYLFFTPYPCVHASEILPENKIYYCPECGRINALHFLFCPDCGVPNPFKSPQFDLKKNFNYNIFKSAATTFEILKTKDKRLNSAKNSFFLSVALPGAGQFALKKYPKAALYFGSFAACVAAGITSKHLANDNYEVYNTTILQQDIEYYREKVKHFDRRSRFFFYSSISIWLFNMLDISNDIYNNYSHFLKINSNNLEIGIKKKL